MEISVIIVNYNTAGHVRNCLNSLSKYKDETSMEIIVVDNNSPERDIEKFTEEFPDVKFLFRNVNDGFGSGCNFGAKESKGNYLVFVNPDIILDSNCLKGMLEYMESNPGTGICCPLLKDFDGNLTYIYNNFPDFRWEINEAAGIGNDKKVLELLEVLKKNDSESAVDVDWVTGAFLFVRSKLFKSVNGYDEDFFLYYEDTDLQYRIRELGFNIVCLKDLEVRHFTNSSIKNENGDNVFFFHINRSKLLYIYKHFGYLKRNILRIIYIAGILVRIITIAFRKKYSGTKKKRLLQYKRMLELYLSGYKSILKSKFEVN